MHLRLAGCRNEPRWPSVRRCEPRWPTSCRLWLAGAERLPSVDLCRMLRELACQLSARDESCCAIVRRLLASSAPAALAALTPHASVEPSASLPADSTPATLVRADEATADGKRVGGGASGGASGGTNGDNDWRLALAQAPAMPSYGPLQLQRTLRLLSGRAPPPLAAAHARLLIICSPSCPPSLMAAVRADAQVCMNSRLHPCHCLWLAPCAFSLPSYAFRSWARGG